MPAPAQVSPPLPISWNCEWTKYYLAHYFTMRTKCATFLTDSFYTNEEIGAIQVFSMIMR